MQKRILSLMFVLFSCIGYQQPLHSMHWLNKPAVLGIICAASSMGALFLGHYSYTYERIAKRHSLNNHTLATLSNTPSTHHQDCRAIEKRSDQMCFGMFILGSIAVISGNRCMGLWGFDPLVKISVLR